MKKHMQIAAAAAVLVLVTSAAFGYALLNPPRKWFSTPKNVRVDSNGIASVTDADHGVTATRNAILVWNTANSQNNLNILTSSTATVSYTQGDGISDIIFADPLGICKGTCLAATLTGYYNSGQQGTCGSLGVVAITDSDISFNLKNKFQTVAEGGSCSREIYLESVVTHEIGHLIGLAHSSSSAALMYPSVTYCVNKPINTDDTNGRNALYVCN
jgi:hypothetical protein